MRRSPPFGYEPEDKGIRISQSAPPFQLLSLFPRDNWSHRHDVDIVLFVQAMTHAPQESSVYLLLFSKSERDAQVRVSRAM